MYISIAIFVASVTHEAVALNCPQLLLAFCFVIPGFMFSWYSAHASDRIFISPALFLIPGSAYFSPPPPALYLLHSLYVAYIPTRDLHCTPVTADSTPGLPPPCLQNPNGCLDVVECYLNQEMEAWVTKAYSVISKVITSLSKMREVRMNR